jgi:hypothetical protein
VQTGERKGERGRRGKQDRVPNEIVPSMTMMDQSQDVPETSTDMWLEDVELQGGNYRVEEVASSPKRQKTLRKGGSDYKPPDRTCSRSRSILPGTC